MKKVYRDILKELDRGRTVLIDVTSACSNDRYRILQRNMSEYSWIDGGGTRFHQSCFVTVYDFETGMYRQPSTSRELVKIMENYDRTRKLKIIDFKVIS